MRVGIKAKLVNDHLVQAMSRCGIKTNVELAKRCRVTPSIIGEFVNLKQVPTDKMAKRLERVLKTPTEDLFPQDLVKEIAKKPQTKFYFSKSVECLPSSQYVGISYNPIEKIDKKLLEETLDSVLSELNQRDREILKMRFGLEDGIEHTLEECGKRFFVTRMRVRQIVSKALNRLRHPTRSKRLKEFLEVDL